MPAIKPSDVRLQILKAAEPAPALYCTGCGRDVRMLAHFEYQIERPVEACFQCLQGMAARVNLVLRFWRSRGERQ
jgi:hypothetical protein